MSSYSLNPSDVILSSKKAQDDEAPWMKVDLNNLKVTTGKNPSTYAPITVRDMSGKYVPLNLKFNNQVISSSAKASKLAAENEAKNVIIMFKEVTKDDLKETDYPDFQHEILMKSNKEFIQALNIISNNYINVVSNQIMNTVGTSNCKFPKLKKSSPVFPFKQSTRIAKAGEDSNGDGQIALEYPLYRIKLTADNTTKKIGYNTEKSGFVYTVFDSKKTDQLNKQQKNKKEKIVPVVAKVKTSKGLVDLTVLNASSFITYMSLISGVINFDSVCVSNAGVSSASKFRVINVWKHKKLDKEIINQEDLNSMASLGTNYDSSEEEDSDVEDSSSKSSKNNKGYTQDEPDSNDDSDLEVEVVKKPTVKKASSDSDEDNKKTTLSKKVAAVKINESESSDESASESSDEEPVKKPIKSVKLKTTTQVLKKKPAKPTTEDSD